MTPTPTTKRCTKCGEVKLVGDFCHDRAQKDGLMGRCRECLTEYRAANREKIAARKAEYRAINREKIAARKAEYRAVNREKIAARQAEYRAVNREKIAARKAEYRAINREKIAARQAEYYAINREKIAEYYAINREKIAEYYAINREKLVARQAEYYAINREKIVAKKIRRDRHRRMTDLYFRLTVNLRSRLYKAIRGNAKTGSAVCDLGCAIAEFKAYIEHLFEPGMTWDNYGSAWQLDHVRPLASFDLKDPAQFKEAVGWWNYAPRWATDNLKKGARPPTDDELHPWM